MSNKQVLQAWVVDALQELGGSGSVVEVSKCIWERHHDDLEQSGDLFYTWQYDLRWAAQNLRDTCVLVRLDGDRTGRWTLSTTSTTGNSGTADWSRIEINAIVDSYLRMLEKEVAGEPYSKAAENRLVAKATGRSRGAIEFKYANISAVLDELGEANVKGYKPRLNFQAALREAVAERIAINPS